MYKGIQFMSACEEKDSQFQFTVCILYLIALQRGTHKNYRTHGRHNIICSQLLPLYSREDINYVLLKAL